MKTPKHEVWPAAGYAWGIVSGPWDEEDNRPRALLGKLWFRSMSDAMGCDNGNMTCLWGTRVEARKALKKLKDMVSKQHRFIQKAYVSRVVAEIRPCGARRVGK